MGKAGIFDAWSDEVIAQLGERPLQQWLEGNALPPIDSYTEAHTWLLEAVKDVPTLKGRLAKLVAKLIQKYLTRSLRSADMPRLTFNLLYFCAGLREPSILEDPLLQMMDEKAVPVANDDSGQYQGVPLIAALRAALAGNQAGEEMLPIWQAMLQDKPDSYLRGTPMDGFEGILGLPSPPREALVGWALARMADYLNDNPFRTRQFKQLLVLVKSRFAGHAWDFELLAARCEWKSWSQKLVGNPIGLVKINYTDVKHAEYVIRRGKRKAVISLPRKYQPSSIQLNPVVRQLVLDFIASSLPTRLLLRFGIEPAIAKITSTDVPRKRIRRNAKDRGKAKTKSKTKPHHGGHEGKNEHTQFVIPKLRVAAEQVPRAIRDVMPEWAVVLYKIDQACFQLD